MRPVRISMMCGCMRSGGEEVFGDFVLKWRAAGGSILSLAVLYANRCDWPQEVSRRQFDI